MPTETTTSKNVLKTAQAAIAHPMSYGDFLEKLGAKDRANAEKHVAACEIGPVPGHARLWQRLACTLMTLSSNLVKVNGQQSVQFYVPDGKYRKQVFALEDLRKDYVTIYCSDVLDEALKLKLVQPAKPGDGANLFRLGKGGETIMVERINGTVENPADFFKHMVGWHREALRITLPINATDAQVEAALTLCALHAESGAATA